MPALVAAVLLLAAPVPADGAGAPADSSATHAAPSDSAARIVRTLAPVEVRALLPDMLSSQTVHAVSGTALRDLPVQSLADALALQAGVVAQAGALHVRGGRTGETTVSLEGVTFNDPITGRALPVPLLAIRRADLVSGAPDASFASGLAGTLDLGTIDPPARRSAEVRWQSDGRLGTRYDRVSAQVGTPLPAGGLGLAAATEVTLDDTSLPTLRSFNRHSVLGMSFGWRAENRLLGFAKIAPVRAPERFSLEVFGGREVDHPYSPNWSLDGWTFIPAEIKAPRVFSPAESAGYQRYRAADHMGITDTRHLAALLSSRVARGPATATLTLGWLRTRETLSPGGNRESPLGTHRPSYGPVDGGDGFYVVWGDYPIYRESDSDTWTLRADGQMALPHGALRTGGGLTYESVATREYEWFPIGWLDGEQVPLDSTRSFDAHAPGGFAYVQGRWVQEGMVLNAGLRAEYFTTGEAGTHQTLPGGGGNWSFSPRLGIAYPISVRDVFSLAYARVQQAPAREFLYDDRRIISNRRPLGNPAMKPATLVSYEASVRHLLSAEWALQTSLFYRDLFGLTGTRWSTIPGRLGALVFTDTDEAHTLGFELSLLHAGGEGRRVEVHYTWMQAWGNESLPGGEPYGPLRGPTIPPIADAPLSWDRRHSVTTSAFWHPAPRWALAWTTRVGSPFPWTPKSFRQPLTNAADRNSERLDWTEVTNLSVQWSPVQAPWASFGVEVRNAFDHRAAHSASLDGFPSPIVNSAYDDYGAYRTETGNGGGAYWSYVGTPHWEAVNDPRLRDEPRTIRASVAARW